MCTMCRFNLAYDLQFNTVGLVCNQGFNICLAFYRNILQYGVKTVSHTPAADVIFQLISQDVRV